MDNSSSTLVQLLLKICCMTSSKTLSVQISYIGFDKPHSEAVSDDPW